MVRTCGPSRRARLIEAPAPNQRAMRPALLRPSLSAPRFFFFLLLLAACGSSDGSGDAGSSDGGRPTADAGHRDGGPNHDAGNDDAGSDDAGPMADAGPDASSADAGRTGEPDAGSPSVCVDDLGAPCDERTPCSSMLECQAGRCGPPGRPMCGGFTGIECPAPYATPCIWYESSDFGPCLTAQERACACAVSDWLECP